MLTILSAPATVAPGATFTATFRVTNDAGQTWTAGGAAPHRLGSQSPQDTDRWGMWRVSLPSDLAPGQSVDVSQAFTAPSIVGAYAFAWQMVHEGLAWVGPIAGQTIQVGASGGGSTPPPIVVDAPAPVYQALPAARPDGSLVSAMIVNTGAYSFGLGPRVATWTYTGAVPFKIVQSCLWTGVDRGGLTDTMAYATRVSDGSLLSLYQLDAYTDAKGLHQVDRAYPETGFVLQPGDVIEMTFFANDIASQGPNKHAHHTLTVWGRYLS